MTRLTAAQRRTLDALLDVLIPPRDDRPGAGELGLASAILEAAAGAPGLEDTLRAGLGALERAAGERGSEAFAALPVDERTPIVRSVAEAAPALVPSLLFHVYASYYQHPKVLTALGLEARAPHPQGYPLEEGDLSLVEPVRARGPIYRVPGEPG